MNGEINKIFSLINKIIKQIMKEEEICTFTRLKKQ
tara:strand:- start:575 stop:679 length:105 start_codon:yes stop_codon:yes gene_type:complete